MTSVTESSSWNPPTSVFVPEQYRGVLASQAHYSETNVPHREGKPAIILVDDQYRMQTEYYDHGCRHRQTKYNERTGTPPGPALVTYAGDRFWYDYNVHHRFEKGPRGEELPAVELANGERAWFQFGAIGRDASNPVDGKGPSLIKPDGKKYYFRHGVLHRDEKDADGNMLPAIIEGDGTAVAYYHEGQRKNKDGTNYISSSTNAESLIPNVHYVSNTARTFDDNVELYREGVRITKKDLEVCPGFEAMNAA